MGAVTMLKSKPVVEAGLPELLKRTSDLLKKNIRPMLKIILVGNNPASLIYTQNKKIFAEKIGAQCEIISLNNDTSEQAFLTSIEKIAKDPLTHGLLIQLPLPEHLSHLNLAEYIPAEKDVDGFHYLNLFHLLQGDKGNKHFIPCTPKGIMELLQHYGIKVAGKNVVVIGRSLIVGKPMALLLTNYDATVTLCHSKTVDLAYHTKRADIIVVAAGKAKFFNSNFLSNEKRSIIIDVGIHSISEMGKSKTCGDVDLESVLTHVSAISPVPGGVGPLTIYSLAQNLLLAAEKYADKSRKN